MYIIWITRYTTHSRPHNAWKHSTASLASPAAKHRLPSANSISGLSEMLAHWTTLWQRVEYRYIQEGREIRDGIKYQHSRIRSTYSSSCSMFRDWIQLPNQPACTESVLLPVAFPAKCIQYACVWTRYEVDPAAGPRVEYRLVYGVMHIGQHMVYPYTKKLGDHPKIQVSSNLLDVSCISPAIAVAHLHLWSMFLSSGP